MVKNLEDKEALLAGIINGDINFIATDHAGTIFKDNKLSDDFSKNI